MLVLRRDGKMRWDYSRLGVHTQYAYQYIALVRPFPQQLLQGSNESNCLFSCHVLVRGCCLNIFSPHRGVQDGYAGEGGNWVLGTCVLGTYSAGREKIIISWLLHITCAMRTRMLQGGKMVNIRDYSTLLGARVPGPHKTGMENPDIV